MEFVATKALVKGVFSTAQGMVVLDPEGPTKKHKTPSLRADVAAELAAAGKVKLLKTKLVDKDEQDELDAKARKVAETEAKKRASAARGARVAEPNDGTATTATTAHPAGSTEGLRADTSDSPPIEDENAGAGDGEDKTETSPRSGHKGRK